MRDKKNSDSSCLKHGVVVGARQAGLRFFQEMLIYWDFPTQPSLLFT